MLDFDRLGYWRWILASIALIGCLYLVLPIIFITVLSFGSSRWLAFPPPGWTLQWYRDFFNDPGWISSLGTSAVVGVIVALLSVLLGFLASFGLVRGRFPGKTVIRNLLIAPMVLPVIVLAVALYSVFLRVGIAGTFFSLICAHLIIALPLSVIVISNALLGVDKSIEDAAVVCGATPIGAVLSITIPSIRFGLLSAAIFSFLASWDEVVLAIFMSSPRLQTFPVRIWTVLRQDLTPTIAAASSLLILASIVILLCVALLQRARLK